MKTIKILILAISSIMFSMIVANAQTVDVDKSEVKWTGKKVGGEHFGKISIKSADITVTNNRITKGIFVIDMTSITCDDIDNADANAQLVGHLNSDDFFGVDKFPEAKFVLKKSSAFKNGSAKLVGDMTIKGKTHPIEFRVNETDTGYKASIVVDRAKYDVKYGSSSFFKGLGDKLIYDDFNLDVNLVVK